MGTDYFGPVPVIVLNKYFQLRADKYQQAGHKWIAMLYGGFSRGELNIFAGGSGSGKISCDDESLHSTGCNKGYSAEFTSSLELSVKNCVPCVQTAMLTRHEHQRHSQETFRY
jgi:hypothetical protein